MFPHISFYVLIHKMYFQSKQNYQPHQRKNSSKYKHPFFLRCKYHNITIEWIATSLRGRVSVHKSRKQRKTRGYMVYKKRTKSTSVCADIDLAPCVIPVNTIFSTFKLNTHCISLSYNSVLTMIVTVFIIRHDIN